MASLPKRRPNSRSHGTHNELRTTRITKEYLTALLLGAICIFISVCLFRYLSGPLKLGIIALLCRHVASFALLIWPCEQSPRLVSSEGVSGKASTHGTCDRSIVCESHSKISVRPISIGQ